MREINGVDVAIQLISRELAQHWATPGISLDIFDAEGTTTADHGTVHTIAEFLASRMEGDVKGSASLVPVGRNHHERALMLSIPLGTTDVWVEHALPLVQVESDRITLLAERLSEMEASLKALQEAHRPHFVRATAEAPLDVKTVIWTPDSKSAASPAVAFLPDGRIQFAIAGLYEFHVDIVLHAITIVPKVWLWHGDSVLQ